MKKRALRRLQTPSEAPGDARGQRLHDWLQTLCADVVNDDLRLELRGSGFRCQSLATQQGHQEAGEIDRSGLQRPGRVRFARLVPESRAAERIMRIGTVRCEARVPDQARSR